MYLPYVRILTRPNEDGVFCITNPKTVAKALNQMNLTGQILTIRRHLRRMPRGTRKDTFIENWVVSTAPELPNSPEEDKAYADYLRTIEERFQKGIV